MPFTGPFDSVKKKLPETLEWNPAGTVQIRVKFKDPNVDPSVRVNISPLGLNLYTKELVIGDVDTQNDVVDLEPIEEALAKLPANQRALSVLCVANEARQMPYEYDLVFFSKDNALEPKAYHFSFDKDHLADNILIPVKLK